MGARKRSKRERAFSLIELLVVISIIAMLMALLFPALRRARSQARAVVCQCNLRQWGFLFNMYLEDHHRQFWPGEPRHQWVWKFERYRLDYSAFAKCPTATKYDPENVFFSTWYQMGYNFQTVEMSYGVNEWLSSAPHPMQPDYYWGKSEVKGTAEIPVLLDSASIEVRPYDWEPVPESPGKPLGSMGIDRHSGGVNMLFMDWSIRHVDIKELWTLKWSRLFNTRGKWTKAGGVQAEDWPEWMRRFKDY